MIRSMTGYGEAERDMPAGRLRIEVKTVNHRFFNPKVRTPPGFDAFEPAITEALKSHLPRGHVSALLSLDRSTADAEGEAQVDLEKAKSYQRALERVQRELALPGEVSLGMLARFGEIFRVRDEDRTAGIEEGAVVELTRAAAASAREMREAEGTRLETDLRARLGEIDRHLGAIEARAPERLTEHRERLRTAVQELTEQVEVDEERLAREIAYLAERWDVNEEIVRFRSHIDLFEEALSASAAEPVGKRLGFLVQEMLREANTIASKSNDAELTHASVALKEEIERIREQVENVE